MNVNFHILIYQPDYNMFLCNIFLCAKISYFICNNILQNILYVTNINSDIIYYFTT